MAVSLRESVQLVSDPRNLDASVEEVFHLMLGVNCRREAAPVTFEPESVTAVVGFGGLLSGACVFKSGSLAAMKIAAHMTGMDFAEIDDTVKDGIGEICNMLAGAWKGRDSRMSSGCLLSTPTVVAGNHYELFSQRASVRIERSYRFETMTFTVTIFCDMSS